MSHIEHQAICISSWNMEKLQILHEDLKTHEIQTTEIVSSRLNSISSFFVTPSGSKAGWDEEEKHLYNIELVKVCIESLNYSDGSNPIDFHVAIYGDSEG